MSSALGINANREAEERSWLRTLQLQKMQNDFNVDMWNKTNAYNSPTNQLRLLKEAGLNPAMFQAAQQTPASEVTASDASSPMNSEQGRLYQNLAQLDPLGRTIQALASEQQIAKLRTDIKYQEMLNEDLRLLIDSKKEPYEMMDEFGEPTGMMANAYQVERAIRHLDLQNRAQEANERTEEVFKKRNEREVYEAVMPFLKEMPRQQLRSLLEDIRTKANDNTLLEGDVALFKKYGISPNDDGYKALIKIALRDPSAFNNIIEGLGKAGQASLSGIINSLRGSGTSHRNGSW